MKNKNNVFFTAKQEKKIIKAIKKAEKNTSGEIRVHIEFESSSNHFQKSLEVFHQLGMHQTKQRNGVLMHISPADKNFTIIGDVGIDNVTPDNFWETIKNHVIIYFKEEKYTKGICVGIELIGLALKEYFPYHDNDINELPDEISYS